MTSSLLQEKLKSGMKERKEIERRVNDSPIRSTKDEGVIVKEILSDVSEHFKRSISRHGLTSDALSEITKFVRDRIKSYNTLSFEKQQRIERMVISNVAGLGPIQPYMDDDTVTEIIVQRFDSICIEKNGIVEPVNAAFMDEEHLQAAINKIIQRVGRQINLATPMVDARLPDGSRINATIPPVTPDGATLTIRKFSKNALTGEDYLRLGSLSSQMLDFLSACVRARISLIVSGGTNSGKTTLLNMLSTYIPDNELIVTIEDSCELQLHQTNVRRMEARQTSAEGVMPVTIQTLVKNALRMRPDRIVIGEVRDGAIVDLMSAMSTGHDGSMSTIHANSPTNLINARIPILYSMNGEAAFSERAQKMQIAEALHLIIQIKHDMDGKRRITHITHVYDYDTKSDNIKLRDVFLYRNGKFEATGYLPEELLTLMADRGVNLSKEVFK